MLDTMEKYNQTLESAIDARTDELRKEKDRTDKLLYSLMPRYICHLLDGLDRYFISNATRTFEMTQCITKLNKQCGRRVRPTWYAPARL